MIQRAFGVALSLTLLAAAPVLAQPAARPACTLTPAQIEANRQAGMAFFKPGITGADRIALLDPSYVQHNPVFKKQAQDTGKSDYDTFKDRVGGPPAPPPAPPAGPRPPAADPYALVTVDCDLVTVLHKNFRQVPGAAAGTWYEVFTFDTFRVKNGKYTEHWDGAVLPNPAN